MKALKPNNQGLSKILIITLLGFIVLVIAGVAFIALQPKPVSPKNVTLTMWGIWDETTDVADIINSYHDAHPYITINYVKKRYEEFANALVTGWATDTGPDIYALPNTWLRDYSTDFITPVPATTKIAFYENKKILFKSETKISYVARNSLTANDIKRDYIDVVYKDIILNGKIYGLPLGVNTLVMFYNKDLLNRAHLAQPPATWNDFVNAVGKITITNDRDEIIRAGAALGTYDNIPNASDLVTLLMLQNGAPMTTGGEVTFDQPTGSEQNYYPAEQALRFYTDFASPEKSVYTWNDNVTTDAFDLFAQGNLGFLFGYRYQQSEITSRGLGADAFGLAPMPQINPDNEVNYADYWVYTVARKSKYANESWAFLQYAADAKRSQPYDNKTKQTSVLRSVISEQIEDPDMGMFAQQALTAQSWYRGKKPQKAEEYFGDMIKSVVARTSDIKQAIILAAQKIQQIY